MDIYLARPGWRWALGQSGWPLLLVIGLNPSRATPSQGDPTFIKVARISRQAGFNGFVLVNLCPLRCAHPRHLPPTWPREWQQENWDRILQVVELGSPTGIWAAWGNGIGQRPYLLESCQVLGSALDHLPWYHYGSLTRWGHPRHPVRVGYGQPLAPFDIARYTQGLKIPSGPDVGRTPPR